MDHLSKNLPSVADRQVGDAPEFEMGHRAVANGRNTRDSIAGSDRYEIACKDFSESLETNTGQDDAQGQDEASRLKSLATDVRDQDDLERDIGRQVRH